MPLLRMEKPNLKVSQYRCVDRVCTVLGAFACWQRHSILNVAMLWPGVFVARLVICTLPVSGVRPECTGVIQVCGCAGCAQPWGPSACWRIHSVRNAAGV